MRSRTGTCSCGECVVKEYAHSLNAGLVRALTSLAGHVSNVGSRDVRASRLPLTHSELANLQKLQYWGFIQPSEKKGTRRRGWWKVTEFAFDFLEAKAHAPRIVWTHRGKFIECGEELVLVGDVVEGYRFEPYYAGSRRSEDRAAVGMAGSLF